MKRSIRSVAALLMLSLASLILSGCWSRTELNELGIAIGLGIDKKGSSYQVSVQVVDPSEVAQDKASGDRTPVTMFQASGRTVIEALRKMTSMSPRRIYFSHLRILVLGEDMARSGISGVMDFIFRSQELRPDYYVVIAKKMLASDTLQVLTPLNKLPADSLYSSLHLAEQLWAPISAVSTNMLIKDLLNPGKELLLTGIELMGDRENSDSMNNVKKIDTPSYLKYSGLAVFQNDKLVGWLNETQSRGYNYVVGKVVTTIGSVPCDSGSGALEIVRTETKMKTWVKEGQPYAKLQVQSEASIPEAECSLDFTKQATIYKLEKLAEKRVKSIINTAIQVAQKEYKTDIFGFGNSIHRSDKKAWNKMKSEWNTYFASMPIEIDVDIKIRGIGTMNSTYRHNQFKEKKEE